MQPAELNVLRFDGLAVTATKIRVTITGRVDYIFAKAIPGMLHADEVTVVAEAEALPRDGYRRCMPVTRANAPRTAA